MQVVKRGEVVRKTAEVAVVDMAVSPCGRFLYCVSGRDSCAVRLDAETLEHDNLFDSSLMADMRNKP